MIGVYSVGKIVMNDILEELIEKNRRNSALNKEDSYKYRKEIRKLLKQNVYTDEVKRYLSIGPTDLPMEELANYVTSSEDKFARPMLENFLHDISKDSTNIQIQGNIIRLCFLQQYISTKSDKKLWTEEIVFLNLVASSYRSDNTLRDTAKKKIKDKIFSLLCKKENIIDLSFINAGHIQGRKFAWNKIKGLFMNIALDPKLSNPKMAKIIFRWLSTAGESMVPYSEDYIDNFYMNHKEEHDDGKKTYQPPAPSTVPVIEHSKSDKDDLKDNEVPDKKAILMIAEVLRKQSSIMNTFSMKLRNLEEKLLEDQELIKSLKNRLDTEQKRGQTLFLEKQKLDEENQMLSQQLESTGMLLEELQSDYDNHNQFSDTVIKGMEKDQEAFMNKLASKLRIDYADFLDAKNEEMTKELGENMRAQLEEVFRILEQNGINIKK